MSNCEQVRGLMPLLSEGELSGEQAQSLRAHIDSCAACKSQFAAFTEIDALLTASGAMVPLPFGARERLAARMRTEEEARRRPATRWVAAGSVAAIAAGVLLTLSIPREKPALAAREERPFIEIPYLAPLAPNESTTVVRTEVQVSALLAAGYRVAAEPDVVVPLDILLGEDGRAHAVRVLADIEVIRNGD